MALHCLLSFLHYIVYLCRSFAINSRAGSLYTWYIGRRTNGEDAGSAGCRRVPFHCRRNGLMSTTHIIGSLYQLTKHTDFVCNQCTGLRKYTGRAKRVTTPQTCNPRLPGAGRGRLTHRETWKKWERRKVQGSSCNFIFLLFVRSDFPQQKTLCLILVFDVKCSLIVLWNIVLVWFNLPIWFILFYFYSSRSKSSPFFSLPPIDRRYSDPGSHSRLPPLRRVLLSVTFLSREAFSHFFPHRLASNFAYPG